TDRFLQAAQPSRDTRRGSLHGDKKSNLPTDQQRKGGVNDSRTFNSSGWLALALLLFLWEYGSRLNPKLQLYIPPISQILVTLGQLISSGQVTAHLLITLRRFVEGYLLAAVLGVSVGVILGYFRFAHSLLEMLIEFLRPMPSVAIIPVVILLLGIGDSMITAVVVFSSVWTRFLICYRVCSVFVSDALV